MGEEEKIQPPQSHEDIIKARDAELTELNTEIALNPEVEWREYEVSDGLKVKLPSRAIIEAEALIQDVSTNLELFQRGHEPLQDHVEIARNPRSFGLVMSGISGGNKDWDGIKVRVALQRGMTIYEDKMEEMDYDDSNAGYQEISSSFDSADKALKALDHLRPMAY